MIWSMIWGAWSLVGLLASALRFRVHDTDSLDRFYASTMLVGTYLITLLLSMGSEVPPAGWGFFPYIDVTCLTIVALSFWHTRRAWKAVLIGLFLFQIALHVALSGALWLHPERSSTEVDSYAVLLNLSFAIQVLVAGWSGLSHVVGWGVSLLPDLRRSHRQPLRD